jgi:hypothetical protein
MRISSSVAVLFASVLVSSCREDRGSAAGPHAERTLESILPKLSAKLTPADAERTLGRPDSTAGSGLIIYLYRIDEGRELWLGFPGFAPIAYAKVRDPNGGFTDLPLQ